MSERRRLLHALYRDHLPSFIHKCFATVEPGGVFKPTWHLDAIAYPTTRRKPTIIGQPQPPSNCQLSAVTGLPAITMPAGFTPDSLPIGVEMLGRSLSDTRLVAIAFSYEQAVHPRRAPRTTPPLANPPRR